MRKLFEGARLKVKRANQHIDQLNTILTDFIKTDDFHRLSVLKNEAGHYVLTYETIKQLPKDVPTILGDAIHNLRSSLDLATNEIVTNPGKYTRFPFQSSRKELIGSINGGSVKTAGTDIVNLIVNDIKPYKGGNGPLCALNDADIMDKHSLLIPVISVSALTNVNVVAGRAIFTGCTFAVSGDGKLNIVGFPENVELQGNVEPRFEVLFDKRIFDGQPLIPTLHQLSQLVSGIMNQMEEKILARNTPQNP
jgi:hypothetical protein